MKNKEQFKCTYCGGELVFSESFNIARCSSCDRKAYIRADDVSGNRIRILQADSLRQKFQFDDAEALYREIVRENPDHVEALFGMLLCNYGIIYVEESEHKFVATMNRYLDEKLTDHKIVKQLKKIVKEPNSQYFVEIEYIESVREKIASKIRADAKYDIFICYKKSVKTEQGVLETLESRYAAKIYKMLIESGYEDIFFAEETLPGDPGAIYEAEIYTALKTAKVMILMCSFKDYVTSSWVQNEWRRFLYEIERDDNKILIPVCLSGFDPNQLPHKIKPKTAMDMQAINFREILLDKLQQKIPLKLSNVVKKQSVIEVKNRKIKERDVVEIQTKTIGRNRGLDYKIHPSVEKAVHTVYEMLLYRGKFDKAIVKFRKLQLEEPLNEAINIGIVLSLYRVSSLDDIPDKGKYDQRVLSAFEQLMQSIDVAQKDKYLTPVIDHAVSEFTQGVFNIEYFNFIMMWLNPKEQFDFSDQIFRALSQALLKAIERENHKFLLKIGIDKILFELNKTLGNEQVDTYLARYTKIAGLYLSEAHFRVAKNLTSSVLALDELYLEAIKIDMLVNYKVTSFDQLKEKIRNTRFEFYLRRILKSTGFDEYVFESLYSAAIYNLELTRVKPSVEIFKTIVSYIPDHENEYMKKLVINYTNELIALELFDDARKLIDYAVSEFPTFVEGHWNRFKIDLKATSNFEVLIKSKKDLMDYQSFANAVNSVETDKDPLDFYDINDRFKENYYHKRSIRRIIKRHYDFFSSFSDREWLKDFNNKIFPELEDNIKKVISTNTSVKVRLRKKILIVVIFTGLAYFLSIARLLAVFELFRWNIDEDSVTFSGIISLYFSIPSFLFIGAAYSFIRHIEIRGDSCTDKGPAIILALLFNVAFSFFGVAIFGSLIGLRLDSILLFHNLWNYILFDVSIITLIIFSFAFPMFSLIAMKRKVLASCLPEHRKLFTGKVNSMRIVVLLVLLAAILFALLQNHIISINSFDIV
jgi:hypothetical protein